jgi:plastocyanin domain-containing protein
MKRGLSILLVTLAVGCSKSDARSSSAAATGRVNIEANDHGFEPHEVTVNKGSATTLVFTRTTDDTCAKEVVFPELHLTKELPLKQAVAVDVPAGDARTLAFQCGMGMFRGKVVIQ